MELAKNKPLPHCTERGTISYYIDMLFVLGEGGIHALHVSVVVKSLSSDFPQALGSVLLLSFVHVPIVLSDLTCDQASLVFVFAAGGNT